MYCDLWTIGTWDTHHPLRPADVLNGWNPYKNKISEWAMIFRYGNFFIPWVEKSSKISPWEKNIAFPGPTALGRTKFFTLGLILEDFSTLGMKKFPYLKTGPFGNPIFLTFQKWDLDIQAARHYNPILQRTYVLLIISPLFLLISQIQYFHSRGTME